MSAVVVMGEAPESEEDNDEIDCGFVNVTVNQFTDELINPPETPPSPSPDFPASKDGSSLHHHQQQRYQQQSASEMDQQKKTSTNKSDSSPSTSNLYDTLFHRKLREKNELLREELIKIACQPYINATKEIDSLSQQLIKSQRMVQQVSGTLSKLTRDLKNVEITLDSFRSDSPVIPSFTTKLTQSSHQQPDITNDASPQDNLLSSSSTST